MITIIIKKFNKYKSIFRCNRVIFFSATLCAEKNTRFFLLKKTIFYKGLNYITCSDTSICRVEFYLLIKWCKLEVGVIGD